MQVSTPPLQGQQAFAVNPSQMAAPLPPPQGTIQALLELAAQNQCLNYCPSTPPLLAVIHDHSKLPDIMTAQIKYAPSGPLPHASMILTYLPTSIGLDQTLVYLNSYYNHSCSSNQMTSYKTFQHSTLFHFSPLTTPMTPWCVVKCCEHLTNNNFSGRRSWATWDPWHEHLEIPSNSYSTRKSCSSYQQCLVI